MGPRSLWRVAVGAWEVWLTPGMELFDRAAASGPAPALAGATVGAGMAAPGSDPAARSARIDQRSAALSELEEIERERRRLDARQLRVLAAALDAAVGATRDSDPEGAAEPEGADAAAGAVPGAVPVDREIAFRSLRLEISVALRLSERAVERLLDTAQRMTTQYPAGTRALENAEVALAHLHVIAEEGRIINSGEPEADADRRDRYAAEVLTIAPHETPNRLRPIARRLAAEAAGADLMAQHTHAVRQRRVWLVARDAGMADLTAYLPAVEASAIMDRLNQLARETVVAEAEGSAPRASGGGPQTSGVGEASGAAAAVAAAGAVADAGAVGPAGGHEAGIATLPRRTRDEVRADALVDLLLGRPGDTAELATRVQGRVQIIVPGKLVGLPGAGSVAELVGHGPIDADTAAEAIASATATERILVDATGGVLAVDRYRPSPRMKRLLAARDLHCRAPGCRAPAFRCDLDHTIDAALGGATSTDNLAHLCRGHHLVKHHGGWTVTQDPDGTLHWKSPTGRVDTDVPPSRLRFRRSAGPPE